jgi:diguanylate cyclase (GGDEF)-like protein
MPDPEKSDSANALKQLQDQLREIRTELRNLQLKTQLSSVSSSDDLADLLVQANEQLVLSTLSAQATAETAVSNFSNLARTSQRDALTDTPNRALMMDRLESALTMAQRRYTRAALIFLDIDHFKQINDQLGHATGDSVLQEVARRLQAAVRDSDAVGRQGGDEFLVLLAEISKMTDAAQIAKKMIADVAAPYLVDGHILHVSVSVGIAVYPDDAQDAATLIRIADTAMYRSKNRGGGSFTFYSQANIKSNHAGTLG